MNHSWSTLTYKIGLIKGFASAIKRWCSSSRYYKVFCPVDASYQIHRAYEGFWFFVKAAYDGFYEIWSESILVSILKEQIKYNSTKSFWFFLYLKENWYNSHKVVFQMNIRRYCYSPLSQIYDHELTVYYTKLMIPCEQKLLEKFHAPLATCTYFFGSGKPH